MPKIIKVIERTKIAKRITWAYKIVFCILSISCFVGFNRLMNKMNVEERAKVTILNKEYKIYDSRSVYRIDYKIDGQEKEHELEITKSSYDEAKIGGHQYYKLTRDRIYDSYYFHPLYCMMLVVVGVVLAIITLAFSIDPRGVDRKEIKIS